MKVHPAILAGAASVQFATMTLLRSPWLWPLGVVLGTATASVLAVLALRGIRAQARSRSREAS
jgi:hypothetical protein